MQNSRRTVPLQTRLLLPALLLSLALASAAQAQLLPLAYYTARDGLPSNWTTAIYQDQRGYLWIGSTEGLAVYDGVDFQNFGVDDGLPVAHVWAIHESRRQPGVIYIGTHGGGLSRLENGTITSHLLGPQQVNNVVGTIFEDQRGVVWCNTVAGVYHVKDDSITFAKTGNDSGWSRIFDQTSAGTIYICIGKNLYRQTPSDSGLVPLQLDLPIESLTALLEDEQGDLWFGTRDGRIFRVRNDSIIAVQNGPLQNIQNMIDDRGGSIYYATGFGLAKFNKAEFDDGAFVVYGKENGLRDTMLQTCAIDRENNIWITHRFSGLARLSDRDILQFPLPGLDIYPGAATNNGRGHLFVAANDGVWELWRRRDGSWQQHLHPLDNADMLDVPSNLVFAPDSTLWVAHKGGGLQVLQTYPQAGAASRLRLVRKFIPGVHLPLIRTTFLQIDDNDQVWYGMANNNGIVQLDAATREIVHHYEQDSSDAISTITALTLDGEGLLWFGGYSVGIQILQPRDGLYQSYRRLYAADGLVAEQIRSLLHRRNGEVWVGTRFDGITIFTGSATTGLSAIDTLTMKDGLYSNAIWNMVEDSSGRVWIATSVGVQYIDPRQPRQLVSHRMLHGRQVGSIGMLDDTGYFWAVSRDEITLYEPDHQSPAATPPPVYVTGLRVDGQDRPLQDGIRFAYDENFCVVRFNGISFKDESALQFRYRLHGLNDSWQEPTEERSVTFASLRPGAYTFEVKAVTTDGIESTAPASFSFAIMPPFWQRWWFLTLAFVAAVALLYLVHRVRLRRLLEIEKIRARIATDLHDDIGAGLTHIGLLSEVTLRRTGMRARALSPQPASGNGDNLPDSHDDAVAAELSHAMDRVGRIARELSAAMSDVVWSINPKHDSVDALLHRLTSFAHEICAAKEIELQLDVSPNLQGMKLNPEIRRNLLLIAKEALHNMAKYSGSPSVQVRLDSDGDHLRLSVIDRGRGFETQHQASGNGLSNMRSRAEKIGGRCDIVSRPGDGTQVIATVPHKA